MKSGGSTQRSAERERSLALADGRALDPTVADLVKYLAEVWAERHFRSIVADTEQPSAPVQD